MGSVATTLLVFNTAERLLRGDFFHCTTTAEIKLQLREFPPGWPVLGLGTTNRIGRHGEVLVDGTADMPRFRWVDPLRQREPVELPVSRDVHLPFAALAVRSLDAPQVAWHFDSESSLLDAVTSQCQAHNYGLAALEVTGWLGPAEHQVMCEIPFGGVQGSAEARVERTTTTGEQLHAVGFYCANETIRTMVGAGSAVHLHGHLGNGGGGHLNFAAARAVDVAVWPIPEMVLRIRNLDVDRKPLSALRA